MARNKKNPQTNGGCFVNLPTPPIYIWIVVSTCICDLDCICISTGGPLLQLDHLSPVSPVPEHVEPDGVEALAQPHPLHPAWGILSLAPAHPGIFLSPLSLSLTLCLCVFVIIKSSWSSPLSQNHRDHHHYHKIIMIMTMTIFSAWPVFLPSLLAGARGFPQGWQTWASAFKRWASSSSSRSWSSSSWSSRSWSSSCSWWSWMMSFLQGTDFLQLQLLPLCFPPPSMGWVLHIILNYKSL